LIPSIHPVFRQLSSPCAFVYEALDELEATMLGQLAMNSALSSTAAADALQELAVHGLAVRVPAGEEHRGGWVRGPITLDAVGLALGVDEIEAQIKARYEDERQAYRKELADFEASYQAGSPPNVDPDPELARQIVSMLALTEPPPEQPGPSDQLPDVVPPDDEQHEPEHDALSSVEPSHNADSKPVAGLSRIHPWAEKNRIRSRGSSSPTAQTAAPPLPPQIQDQLIAESPGLELLVEELGAVILDYYLTRPAAPRSRSPGNARGARRVGK
jgi:hypothetical protein